MEQPGYLIDTNAVIDYLGKRFSISGMSFMNSVIDAVPNVSIITKIEVLGFNTPDNHYHTLSNFMSDATVIDLTDEVVDVCIALRKEYKIKLPDAIIAATAMVYDFTLITRNVKDFKSILGLKVENAHSH